jgi:hypothetical protein
VGIQESFAEEKTWYVGEGLKKGDYFSYSLCHWDYEQCKEFRMDFWIEGDAQEQGETRWLALTRIYDESNAVIGSMTLGKLVAEPTGGSENIATYRGVFKASVATLSSLVSQKNPGNLTEGIFVKKNSWYSVGTVPNTLFISKPQPTEIPFGTFQAVTLESATYQNKIWVIDEFPFPIKAHFLKEEPCEPNCHYEYRFELLYYDNLKESPFVQAEYISDEFNRFSNHYAHESRISIDVVNGVLIDFNWDKDIGTMNIITAMEDDGKIVLIIPKTVWHLADSECNSKSPIILINGHEAEYEEIFTKQARIIEIDLSGGGNTIEIIYDSDNTSYTSQVAFGEFCAELENGNYLPPTKQSKLGFRFHDVICRNDTFVLALKPSDHSTICIKSESASKLLERGYISKVYNENMN